VRQLIKQGADVNVKSNRGDATLIKAAKYGHTDIVKLLIQAGADVNAKNNEDKTALDLIPGGTYGYL